MSVRVTAPPEDGKANAAVRKLLAGALGVPKTAVRVIRGDTARHKMLEIEGMAEEDLVRVFGGPR